MQDILEELKSISDPAYIPVVRRYFRNPEEMTFIGTRKAGIKALARRFSFLPRSEILKCLQSEIHEARSLALWILRSRYDLGLARERQAIFRFYLAHREYLSQWDLVDESAPYLVGRHLLNRDDSLLFELVRSQTLWDRRIAIVSTWWFIRHGKWEMTLRLAQLLLSDPEDLIHKATGWMLREVGKKSPQSLTGFLDLHHSRMPRPMLSSALEHLSTEDRKRYRSRHSSSPDPGGGN